ncbi:MAG TPA: hypothetical protein VGY66_08445 [Gemmataceae bacterium]|jgi:hypothetical protein|nr:hypothetical protein [Gemmataceae bacterium]
MSCLLKRWWFWGATGFMLITVCAGYLFIPVPSRITQADCDKLELGWTLEQVIEAVGEKHLFLDLGWEVYFADDDNNIIVTKFRYTQDGSRLLRNRYFEPTQFSFLERTKRRFDRRLRALRP